MKPLSVMISTPCDVHAIAISWAAREMGANTCFLDSSHFISKNAALALGKSSSVEMDGINSGEGCRLWFRKGASNKTIDAAPEDYNFVLGEWQDFERGVLGLAESLNQFTWVNKLSSLNSSENKAVQLLEAIRSGLNVPKTLITANYNKILSFVEDIGSVVIKPSVPHTWISSDGAARNVMYARKLDFNQISKFSTESITQAPMFYQQCIDKIADIRVTVIGGEIFSTKMTYDVNKGVDFREFQHEDEFFYESYSIDHDTKVKLLNLLKKFELRVVSADFLLDKKGELHFIDLNPSGAFLFMEKFVPELKVLGAAVREFTFNQNINMVGAPSLSEFLSSPEHVNSLKHGKNKMARKIANRGVTFL